MEEFNTEIGKRSGAFNRVLYRNRHPISTGEIVSERLGDISNRLCPGARYIARNCHPLDSVDANNMFEDLAKAQAASVPEYLNDFSQSNLDSKVSECPTINVGSSESLKDLLNLYGQLMRFDDYGVVKFLNYTRKDVVDLLRSGSSLEEFTCDNRLELATRIYGMTGYKDENYMPVSEIARLFNLRPESLRDKSMEMYGTSRKLSKMNSVASRRKKLCNEFETSGMSKAEFVKLKAKELGLSKSTIYRDLSKSF